MLRRGRLGSTRGDGVAEVGDGFRRVAGGADEDDVGEAVLILFGRGGGCGAVDGIAWCKRLDLGEWDVSHRGRAWCRGIIGFGVAGDADDLPGAFDGVDADGESRPRASPLGK